MKLKKQTKKDTKEVKKEVTKRKGKKSETVNENEDKSSSSSEVTTVRSKRQQKKKDNKKVDTTTSDNRNDQKNGSNKKEKKIEAKHETKDKTGKSKAIPETKAKNSKKANKKSSKDEDEQEDDKKEPEKEQENTKLTTVIEKGGCVVDKCIQNASEYHVVLDKGNEFNGKFFDVTLNQSNLQNNNNKFYIIQLLRMDKTNSYFIYFRWGRVGVDGQKSLNPVSLDDGKEIFLKKYREKISGGYDHIHIDYSKDEEKKNVKKSKNDDKSNKKSESNLEKPLQELMELIYNLNIMNQQMKEIGYDANKMPLGKLGKETLKEGYEILKEIEAVLDNKKKGNLFDLSSKFYTKIPHDFGFKKMSNFVLDSKVKLKEKVDMIQSLADIEIATKIVDEIKESQEDIYETYYKKLQCNMRHIKSHEKVYSVIEEYLTNTSSDNSYQKLEILEAFEVEKHNEKEKFVNYGNRKLLWHGSRITNYVGILSQGLRIAPPEAPVSGYLFGKGVYFADMASKSACYCYPSNNIALILLCEVSLGNPRELNTTDHNAANLPNGCHSTKGNGQTVPSKEIDLEDGLKVPLGKPTKSSNNTYLGYNEYIVYDTKQVKLKYLLKIKYNYGKR